MKTIGETAGPTFRSRAALRPRRLRAGSGLAAALCAGFSCGCGGGESPTPPPSLVPAPAASAPAAAWFEECARERGLRFEHVSGHRPERYLFPEIMGGGAALLDADRDGDLDAYLVQSGSLEEPGERGANRLFANEGGGRFRDATAASGAADPGYGMGVAAGDADGDGDADLYVTNTGPNALLVNEGGLCFRDRTEAAGVGDPRWSVSAAFFDAEADGDLDLFVANYVHWSAADELACLGRAGQEPDYCSPKSYAAPAPDTFYRNEGDGTFADESARAGIRTAFGNGLGVLCSDHDGDGRTDVLVANDGTLNQLWHNLGDARFEDRAAALGLAADEHGIAKAGMGVACADLDDDGDEDLLIVNLALESDSFYRNDGQWFTDRTALAGLAVANRRHTRFGAGFADFDHDGWLDLFQANGRVARGEERDGGDPYAEPNLVWAGGPGPRFTALAAPEGGAGRVATSRGAAFGDVDGDGAVDVLVVNRDGPAHLYRNLAGGRGRWIELDLRERSGAAALGARVTADLGERRLLRTVRSAYSYACASAATVHVGLGEARELSAVRVVWADGGSESFGTLAAGRRHTLRRGEGHE